MSTQGRHLLITVAVLAASACARDETPTGPELGPASATADALRYRVRDLGTLGGHFSFGFGINRHAEVVGSSERADGLFRAFRWKQGTMIGLGSLEGRGGSSAARAINDAGHIVGQSSTSSNVARAFLWRDGVMTELFTPGGNSGANSINSLGQVVGYAGLSGTEHPVLWHNGGITDLGTLGGSFGEASDINDAGQIVGGTRISEDNETIHAFLWEDGVMKDLGSLGGSTSWAAGINADGVIVGWSTTPGEEEHAVMWKGRRIIDLGAEEPLQTRALAINGEEVKVGSTSGGDAGPVFWRFRRARSLPTLGRPGGSATDINQRGQIVGSSILRNSDEHAVLWRLE